MLLGQDMPVVVAVDPELVAVAVPVLEAVLEVAEQAEAAAS